MKCAGMGGMVKFLAPVQNSTEKSGHIISSLPSVFRPPCVVPRALCCYGTR